MRGPIDKSSLGMSVALHVGVLIAFFFLVRVLDRVRPDEPVDVVFYRVEQEVPVPVIEDEPEPEPIPEPEPLPEPEPQVERQPQPKVVAPEPAPQRQPEPQPEPQPKRPPKPQPVRVTQALEPQPKPKKPEPKPKPKRKVKTNTFGSSTETTAPTKEPRRVASTGAFASNEPAENVKPARKALRGGTKVGGFNAEAPTSTQNSAATPSREVQTAGFGAGSGDAKPRRSPTGNRGNVQTAGFNATPTTKRPSGRSRQVAQPAPDTPVEVLSKATPRYTSEARELRVEGEVTLNVTFHADGSLTVGDVVQGLGHGLDEAAIEAAKKIRFKPARRDGQPVDHTAVVRIVFQLV